MRQSTLKKANSFSRKIKKLKCEVQGLKSIRKSTWIELHDVGAYIDSEIETREREIRSLNSKLKRL